MTTKRTLRAVADGESTAKPSVSRAKTPKSVAEAAETGSHRDLLVAMRQRISRTVSDPDCPPRDLAALTRRLQDIAKEIDALDLRAKQEAEESSSDGSDEAWDENAI